MNRLLVTPVHRMTARASAGAGVRWSSYVGDLRCLDSLSKSYCSLRTDAFPSSFNGPYGSSLHNQDGLLPKKGGGAHPGSPPARSLSTKPPTGAKIGKPSARSSVRGHASLPPGDAAPHERLLVLGSGVAGCAAALTAARHGIPVSVLHAGSWRDDCNSYWAQGGIIYRNYRLREEEGTKREGEGDGGELPLVDTPLSLVNDIRVASGYTAPLQRNDGLEERTYSPGLYRNDPSRPKMGRTCPTSGVHWNEDAAWKLACEGPGRVRELLLGSRDEGHGESRGCVVPFDRTGAGKEDDVLSLCLEASHAAPRIIHHADCTGKAITTCLTKAASEHPLIEFVGDAVATDLIVDEGDGRTDDGMVIGVRVLDKRTNRLSNQYAVHGVVLASGGLAGIYEHSTNPSGFNALGSSVGLALRLEELLGGTGSGGSHGSNGNGHGVVSDLEYVQFHPTSLCLPGEARFLLTEALRGEGAVLRDGDGRPFAADYHPNAELAPRDIVARAVFCESQKSGGPGEQHNAYLDISHRDARWLKDRFPSIDAHLSSRKVPMDFTRESIPVIPAAHYTCGGVTTDLHGRVVDERRGRHPNLYAAGEAARTGLHGGNRLASTSLLEGLVFGASVGEMVAGVAGIGGGDDADDDAASEEAREEVTEAMHRARHSIEHRLVMEQRVGGGGGGSTASSSEGRASSSREATAMLAHLKSLMWDHVGVVREPSKLATAASELAALRDEADALWERGVDGGAAGWEAAAVRDAARAGWAVAEAARANPVSGGAHYVVTSSDDDDEAEESDESDDDEGAVVAGGDSDSDEEEGDLVAARA